jgi:hypothetical protein
MQGDGGSSIRVCPLDNDLTTVNNKDDVDGLECEIPSPLYYIELEKEAPYRALDTSCTQRNKLNHMLHHIG